MSDISHNVRVLLVDAHPVFGEGLKVLLEGAHLGFAGAASTVREATAALADAVADVVLVAVRLGDDPPLDALSALKRAAPAARLLVLADAHDAARQRQALLAGAHGFVSKEAPPAVLLKAIRAVHAGELWFDRRVLESTLHDAFEAVQRLDPDRARIAALTPREHEVTSLVAEGLRNPEIARRLSLSEKTVRNHVVEACRKLGVNGRLELIVYANQRGLGRLGRGGPLR